MGKLVVRIIVLLFAVIGAISVSRFLAIFVRGEQPKPDWTSFFDSPNKKFKAVQMMWTGGGGISPYCFDRVIVIPGVSGIENIDYGKFVVFSGSCGTFSPRNGIVENSPIIAWESDSRLRITFSINATAMRPADFQLRKQDASGGIGVEFEVRE